MKKINKIICLIIFSCLFFNFSFAAGILSKLSENLFFKRETASRADTVSLQKYFNEKFGTNLKEDGIFGPKTEAAFNKLLKLKQPTPTESPTPVSKPPTEDNKNPNPTQEKNLAETLANSKKDEPKNPDDMLKGSGKGDALGKSRLTSYCADKNGELEKGGVNSCAGKSYPSSWLGNCGGNCKYIKNSCGGPTFYFENKSGVDNWKQDAKNFPLRDKNKTICEVALSRGKLIETFGESQVNGKKYCGKTINIQVAGKQPVSLPINNTGLSQNDRVDITGGCANEKFGVDIEKNYVYANIFRANEKDLQVADVAKSKLK